MHVILTGIFVSLVITELTGFSPGGIVVAGYLSMFATQPVWLLGTLIAALITHLLVRLLSNHLLLYGRRLFAIYLLTGILISQGGMLLSRNLPLITLRCRLPGDRLSDPRLNCP